MLLIHDHNSNSGAHSRVAIAEDLIKEICLCQRVLYFIDGNELSLLELDNLFLSVHNSGLLRFSIIFNDVVCVEISLFIKRALSSVIVGLEHGVSFQAKFAFNDVSGLLGICYFHFQAERLPYHTELEASNWLDAARSTGLA